MKKNWKIHEILNEKLNHLKMREEIKFTNELNENLLINEQHRLHEQTLNQSGLLPLLNLENYTSVPEEIENIQRVIQENYETQRRQDELLHSLNDRYERQVNKMVSTTTPRNKPFLQELLKGNILSIENKEFKGKLHLQKKMNEILMDEIKRLKQVTRQPPSVQILDQFN